MEFKVTPEELINFMISKKYTNFKKTKNNKPDMRCTFNKQYYNLLVKIKMCEKNKKENIHTFTTAKEKDYRKEIIDMTDEDIELFKNINESCVICGEIMKNNHSVLKCKHVFCNDCMISHFRVKDNCPLCRTTICEKPKKIIPMSSQLCEGFIDHEMNVLNQYPIENELLVQDSEDKRFVTNLMTLLYYYELSCDSSLEQDEATNQAMKESLKLSILRLIKLMALRSCSKICMYYDEQC